MLASRLGTEIGVNGSVFWDLGEDVRLTNSCELPAQVRLGGTCKGMYSGFRGDIYL